MAINLRSPYYIGSNIQTDGYNVYKIYIYEDTQPASPTYTITKNYVSSSAGGKIEISELVRDYIDVTFGQDYTSQCIKVFTEWQTFDSNGNSEDFDIEELFAFDSYSYFEENDFDVNDSPVMISNRKIFGLEDNLVRVPINTKNDPTVVFFKDGVVVGSQSFTSDNVVANQIRYVTLGGESDDDNYVDRILSADGGVYEENKCIVAFLGEFEIGEVDEIRVSDDNGNLEIINVEVLTECKYEPKKVTFINKFGALQDMHFFKKSVEMMNVEKESYKSNIISNGVYSRSSHVNRNFNVVGKESITLSSGFLSEEYNEVFKQLLLSEKVWITDKTAQVLPINVTTSDITYKTSLNDKLVEYTIEFDNSYNTINNIR